VYWRRHARINRALALRNVPAVTESGIKGVEASTWLGFMAVACMPAPIVARLTPEITRVLAGADDRRERFANAGEKSENRARNICGVPEIRTCEMG
jgi:tripartite-type tricarboxylate transporter receptor subunit TctC